MKFCPECEVRLKKINSVLQCPKCGYDEGKTSQTSKTVIEEKEVSEFNVFDANEGQETLPTIKIDCKKCGPIRSSGTDGRSWAPDLLGSQGVGGETRPLRHSGSSTRRHAALVVFPPLSMAITKSQ